MQGPDTNGGYHCQAQAYINGEWHFLQVAPVRILVVTDKKDDWYTVEGEYDVKDFIDIYWGHLLTQ